MEVTLKRNGWHRKLQQYVFSNPPTFNNLCPYFWLTVFCFIFTFIIPIVPLVKFLSWFFVKLGRGIVAFFDTAGDWYDKNICDPMWKNMAVNMKEDDLIKSWTIDTYNHRYRLEDREWNEYAFWADTQFNGNVSSVKSKKREAALKKFELWKANTVDWEKKLDEIKEKRRKFFEEQEKEKARLREEYYKREAEENAKAEARKKRQQQMYTAIVKYTKWLAYVLVAIAAVAVALGLYWVGIQIWHLIQWGIAHFNYDNFIYTLKVIGIGIVIMLGAVGLFFLIRKLSCNITICIDWDRVAKSWYAWPFVKLAQMFVWIFKGLVAIFVGIGAGFKFIGTFVMATKKDYCPAINWVEDDKKSNA